MIVVSTRFKTVTTEIRNRLVLVSALLLSLTLTAEAQTQRTENHIQLIEKTCLGLWRETNMEVDEKRRDVTLPVYGCDGAIMLQEEVDGAGPIRFFSYVPLTPQRYEPGYDPNVEPQHRMRSRETISDPTVTCRIRIAIRKYFKPHTKAPTSGSISGDPDQPPRKNWQLDAPSDCQMIS